MNSPQVNAGPEKRYAPGPERQQPAVVLPEDNFSRHFIHPVDLLQIEGAIGHSKRSMREEFAREAKKNKACRFLERAVVIGDEQIAPRDLELMKQAIAGDNGGTGFAVNNDARTQRPFFVRASVALQCETRGRLHSDV